MGSLKGREDGCGHHLFGVDIEEFKEDDNEKGRDPCDQYSVTAHSLTSERMNENWRTFVD